jgi:hypothetical protein
MSTASSVPNPAPDTVTVVVGGPLTADSAMPGVTVNVFVVDAVPPGPVTATGPVEAPAGTVAVILDAESTVNSLAAVLNVTPVAPANPEPVIVTSAPIVPEAGLNELTTGTAAA